MDTSSTIHTEWRLDSRMILRGQYTSQSSSSPRLGPADCAAPLRTVPGICAPSLARGPTVCQASATGMAVLLLYDAPPSGTDRVGMPPPEASRLVASRDDWYAGDTSQHGEAGLDWLYLAVVSCRYSLYARHPSTDGIHRGDRSDLHRPASHCFGTGPGQNA
jgi:hypothetical protein